MSDDTVDVVLFEVAGVRYGVDLTQVRRVVRFDPLEVPGVGAPLGEPALGARALVFSGPDGGEASLPFDDLVGVRSLPLSELRRLPPVVQGAPFSVGAWLDGDEAVLLVDFSRFPVPQGAT